MPVLPSILLASRSLGCTLEGERLEEESQTPPPEVFKDFNGVNLWEP